LWLPTAFDVLGKSAPHHCFGHFDDIDNPFSSAKMRSLVAFEWFIMLFFVLDLTETSF